MIKLYINNISSIIASPDLSSRLGALKSSAFQLSENTPREYPPTNEETPLAPRDAISPRKHENSLKDLPVVLDLNPRRPSPRNRKAIHEV